MKPPKLFDGLSTTEKRFISSALFLIIFLLVFVNVYDFGSFSSSENQIGQIQDLTNNTRVKSNQRVLWQNAHKRQSVHLGDKIFTGKKSTATVKLGKTGSFSLGENSLVEFQTVSRQKVANFKNGTYRLSSNGKLTIAINGKVAEIDAANSEFEVVVNGTNNIQIKTIKGNGQIKINNKVTNLTEGNTAQPIPIERMIAKTAAQKVDIPPFTTSYSPKLYDEYIRENGALKKRDIKHQVVQKAVRLAVPTSSPSQEITIQHSGNNVFSSSYEHKTFGFDKKIQKVFLGENYWRYKTESDDWSDTYNFTVQKEYPPNSKPDLHFASQNLFLMGETVEGRFSVSTPYSAIGYVIETSRNNDFAANDRVSWQKSNAVSLKINKTGTLYFRARSVDKDFQLSDWSDTYSFNVATPPALKPIALKVSSHSIRVGESVFARWEAQPTIKKYRLNVAKGSKKVLSVPLAAASSDWFPKTPGKYSMSVSATDEFGRDVDSNVEDVEVAEPFILTKAAPVERAPAANEMALENVEEADVSTTVEDSPITLNRFYTHSFLTLSTSHLSLNSKPHDKVSQDFSTTALLSADYLYWINNHGFQGILQKSVVSLSSGVDESDILIGEARYRYRIAPRDSSQLLRAFQLSVFGGYEFYRNSKSTFFLSSYNFIKGGLTVDIPMFDRFVLSGVGSYGKQSGGMKYDMAWDLTYFMRKQMGVGLGYKFNFVEMDLSTEFPGFLPYREGYAQGTVNFKYFF